MNSESAPDVDAALPARRRMAPASRLAARVSAPVCGLMLGACTSTAITLDPPQQAPVCNRSATALVLWAPEWRPDQKDVVEREAAAAVGLSRFLENSGCFARSELRRVPDPSPATVASQLPPSARRFDRMVYVGVRELGPVLRLLSSRALMEGGTEVVLRITAYSVPAVDHPREFTVHWRSGGPGVLKGVAGLPADMHSALQAGLQPSNAAR